jgi:glycosyltransferase involved in cell wall biosynthesis
MTPTSVVIVQRFLPHYRLPFFGSLAVALGDLSMPLHVLFSRGPERGEAPDWAVRIAAAGIRLNLRAMEDTAMFAPGVWPELGRRRPVVAVLEDVGGFPTNLLAARWCRTHGVPYLVWGLGRIPGNPGSRLRRWLGGVIDRYYRGAAGFVCYSTHAADVYSAYGKPTTVALNAALPRPTPTEAAATHEAIARRAGAPALRIVALGRLLPQKSFDVLLEAVALLDGRTWELHVIGGGPDLHRLRRRATELAIDDRVTFHGPRYDESYKRPLLRSCHLGVLPGLGGLAVQELMWHGVPVIAGMADGTERDVIRPENGVLLDARPAAPQLSAALRRFAALDDHARRRMAAAAVDTVTDRAHLQGMVAGFVRALTPHLTPEVRS